MGSKVSLAREIAYDAFREVMDRQAAPEEVLEDLSRPHAASLRRLDHNFMKEMLYGSLRWYSKIYWILQHSTKRDLDQTSPDIRVALIMGTYQIFYMDRVPDRAAVNESVEYVRCKRQHQAVTFINGILRNIARRAEYFPKPDKDKHPIEYLALQYAHPRWMVERWLKRFGYEQTKQIVSSHNYPPPCTVRINVLKTPLDEVQSLRVALLRDEKNHSDKFQLRSALMLQDSPQLHKDSLFGRGYYTIQDGASQLIASLVDPQEGDLVVDACAGKGGKSTHLYEMSGGKARVLGLDKNPDSLALAETACKRLGHEGLVFVNQNFLDYRPSDQGDGMWEALGSHCKLLLDAPCSGLGVLRRHPEGKWHKKQGIVEAMAGIQRQLLRHAMEILPVGGELIYSVCSFEYEETLAHRSWILEEFKDKMEWVSPLGRLPDYFKRFVTREHVLLIYSGNKDSMDGFGAFIFRKTASL